jgi:hypothetical protein
MKRQEGVRRLPFESVRLVSEWLPVCEAEALRARVLGEHGLATELERATRA